MKCDTNFIPSLEIDKKVKISVTDLLVPTKHKSPRIRTSTVTIFQTSLPIRAIGYRVEL